MRVCWLLLLASAAFGQAVAPERLEFEVAAIKPSDPGSPVAIRRSGNRLSTSNTSLAMLIAWAYDTKPDRLFNKPKWPDDVRFDITANAPEASPQVTGGMQRRMRHLLESRFHPAIRTEMRELPIFALIVDKAGLKIRPVPQTEAIGQNPFRMAGPGRLAGTAVTAAMLANVLSDQLSRSVQDQTGVAGVFDFTLEWTPDSAGDTPLPNGPSLFTALPEQLGLRLEARKAPVEVLVIDRVDNVPEGN